MTGTAAILFTTLLSSPPVLPPSERSANEMLIPMLVVLGIVIMAIMLGMSMRGKIARRQAESLSPRERLDQIKADAEHRARRQGLSPESLDIAQSLATLLDTKSARLELLLEEAEHRIAQLESLVREASPQQQAISEPAPPVESPRDVPPPRRAAHANADAVDPLSRSVYELADTGRTPVQIAQQLDEQVGKVELILALRQSRG
ncbi:MAG TPA: hypothetical protein PK400_03945 [Phycisphaerales bacterium]|nr:hypothetical protein [Phycisphaerales bacterium]HRQ76839.1 hypothetical protein [Phycisphaerales bacterium]